MNRLLILSVFILACLLVFKFNSSSDKEFNSSSITKIPVKNQKTNSTNQTEKINELPESSSVSDFITSLLDTNRTVLERTPEIYKLRQKRLSKADEKALLSHLEKVHFNESQAIKNDIIEHMVRYGSDKQQVGQSLIKVLKNPQQDRVIREYTLQYIPEYYINRWGGPQNWDNIEEEERQILNNTLWEMTDLTEGSMAGGALFALFRLADKFEDLSQENVFNKSLEIMSDPSYMNPNRMGAVQILAFSKNEEYFKAAKEILYDESQPVLLKVTAIHTAAQSRVKDKDFIKYLKTMAKGGEGIHPSLSKCANLTLSKIKY